MAHVIRYTLGPWKKSTSFDPVIIWGNDNKQIAELKYPATSAGISLDPDFHERQVANARLITEAPEMIETICIIFDYLDSLELDVKSKEFELWKLCNDTIKKAIG